MAVTISSGGSKIYKTAVMVSDQTNLKFPMRANAAVTKITKYRLLGKSYRSPIFCKFSHANLAKRVDKRFVAWYNFRVAKTERKLYPPIPNAQSPVFAICALPEFVKTVRTSFSWFTR